MAAGEVRRGFRARSGFVARRRSGSYVEHAKPEIARKPQARRRPQCAADFARGRALSRAGVASGYVEHAKPEIARKTQALRPDERGRRLYGVRVRFAGAPPPEQLIPRLFALGFRCGGGASGPRAFCRRRGVASRPVQCGSGGTAVALRGGAPRPAPQHSALGKAPEDRRRLRHIEIPPLTASGSTARVAVRKRSARAPRTRRSSTNVVSIRTRGATRKQSHR